MPSAITIALSGMHAAQQQLRSAGHNIANVSTPKFRREQVQLSTQADGGGVSASTRTAAEEGEDLATDTVGLLQARNAFLANLAVFKAKDRMTGVLLQEEV